MVERGNVIKLTCTYLEIPRCDLRFFVDLYRKTFLLYKRRPSYTDRFTSAARRTQTEGEEGWDRDGPPSRQPTVGGESYVGQEVLPV